MQCFEKQSFVAYKQQYLRSDMKELQNMLHTNYIRMFHYNQFVKQLSINDNTACHCSDPNYKKYINQPHGHIITVI